MRAIVQDTYGSPDVLELRDIPVPQPGPGEVLVRVRAAGVDPGVWFLLTGKPYLVRLMGFGVRRPKSPVRGMDVAGRVEAVGPGVTRFQPGDDVYGTCDGSYAEYACAAADRFARKPANLDFAAAAAVPISACTALQALRDRGEVRDGTRVLIIGAAGGVGTFAVQVAKAFGAHVTGVCSTAKTDLVAGLGADEVIDYTRADFAGNRRYDVILDIAGNRPLSALRRALTDRGTLVLVGGAQTGRWVGNMARMARVMLVGMFLRQRVRNLFATEPAADLETLREMIEAGTVRPVINRSYPLAEAAQAIGYVHGGHSAGKVVVTV
ncbi:NAD(P)-dependent alcohol dehydrogenase [Actinophytocola sp.]|uniref:NAD(P)-dependent alcohol dehydrogenase n=1 Tax=Actinophytocola sp. TaxID=1872138 RepID=UPI002D7E7E67|nr:NAD(P)-dependent alcohol dehydrogenase [Actinophytocola sp.]HET9142486.1 NAD(P)-dependent alcohol dehydrogenase [Actinophytocola sp.]